VFEFRREKPVAQDVQLVACTLQLAHDEEQIKHVLVDKEK
jgi:hypothetical protein